MDTIFRVHKKPNKFLAKKRSQQKKQFKNKQFHWLFLLHYVIVFVTHWSVWTINITLGHAVLKMAPQIVGGGGGEHQICMHNTRP